MSLTTYFTVASLLVLGACAVGPRYVAPPTAAGEHWLEPADVGSVDIGWWRSLNDALLTELVAGAVAHNLDLKEADERLREARANRDAAAGRRLPELDLDGSATRNRVSENGEIPVGRLPGFKRNFTLFDAHFDASWEIDLWGHQARTVESAAARAEAAGATRHDTMLRVIAEVVRTYIDLRSAQTQLTSAVADAQAQGEIAALVKTRYAAGESSRFDFLRADAQARTSRALMPGFDSSAHAAAYRLALLTGQTPEAIADRLLAAAPLPTGQPKVAAGLRADLLRRRPDVRKAERELAAATADVGVATADLFPRFTLIGSYGQQAQSGTQFAAASSNQFAVGPSLHWPVFAGGAIRANIRAADARAAAAGARYQNAVLTALSDSETALNRFAAAQRTQDDADAARCQTGEALILARQRYRAGEDDLIVLLDAQSADSAAEKQAIGAWAATLDALVALYKALGGGWESIETESAQNIAR